MSNDANSWGYHKVMKLINLIRSNPVIWDTDDEQFHNKFKRELAYDEISFAMNTTNEIIKKKIHTMRSQYLVEYKKLKSKRHYKPCWQYFDDFRFIYKHENINFETPVTLDDYKKPCPKLNDDNSNTEDSQDLDILDDAFVIEFEENTMTNFSANNLPRKRRNLNDESEMHNKSGSDSNKRTKMEVAEEIQDEFSIFGENIANELRLLKGHQIIHNTLKLKIIRAIKEAKFALSKARVNT